MNRTTEIYKYFPNVADKFTLHDRVGGGSFGDVFIGHGIKTDQRVT